MIDNFLGERLVVYMESGNIYVGTYADRIFLPPHKYLLMRLDSSVGPYKEGDYVYIKTSFIESFEKID